VVLCIRQNFYTDVMAGKLRNNAHPLFSSVAVVPCTGMGTCCLCAPAQAADEAKVGVGHEPERAHHEHIVGVVLAHLASPRTRNQAPLFRTGTHNVCRLSLVCCCGRLLGGCGAVMPSSLCCPSFSLVCALCAERALHTHAGCGESVPSQRAGSSVGSTVCC